MIEKLYKKIPWGIVSGVAFMLFSYCLIGFVAVKVVSHLMIEVSGGDDGLGNSWWLSLLVAGFIIFFVIGAASFVLNIIKNKQISKEEEED